MHHTRFEDFQINTLNFYLICSVDYRHNVNLVWFNVVNDSVQWTFIPASHTSRGFSLRP